MNITILPADTYTVFNKTIITEVDRKIITLLYQPIIGHSAVSLYFTLLDDLDKKEIMSENLTHYHLMSTMDMNLNNLVIARQKLEAIGLIKTYYKTGSVNDYVYLIYSPLQAADFFNHPILNVVLYNNLGKKEYQKILEYFKIPKINLKDYQDISSTFDSCFKSVTPTFEYLNEDIIEKNNNKLELNNLIDYNMLIESIPKNIVSNKCFTKDVIDLINSLYYIYQLDMDVLITLVRDNITIKGTIDKTELRKACRNYYQFENSGKLPTVIYKTQPEHLRNPKGDNSKKARLIYSFETTSPYDFLASKCKSGEPSLKDIKLIEELMIDRKLNPGVINVLLSYVLHVNNQKLTKNFIDTIASQWQRLNIETVEEALNITEKEHKKYKKQTKGGIINNSSSNNKENLPEWFNKKLESKELTDEESEEMNQILKELV